MVNRWARNVLIVLCGVDVLLRNESKKLRKKIFIFSRSITLSSNTFLPIHFLSRLSFLILPLSLFLSSLPSPSYILPLFSPLLLSLSFPSFPLPLHPSYQFSPHFIPSRKPLHPSIYFPFPYLSLTLTSHPIPSIPFPSYNLSPPPSHGEEAR